MGRNPSRLIYGYLSSLVIRVLSLPLQQPSVHRAFYGLLAGYFDADTPWHFMNYGFESDRFRECPLDLRSEDATSRLGIQLYDHLLSSLSVAGLAVLEVGCGRGGGAKYVANYLTPHRMVGIDFCHRSVRICRANHDRHVAFLTADAQNLPFCAASFDVVINVESSHAYPSMAAFLEEVHRVLRPGGFLVFADLRWKPRGNATRATGLTLLKRQLLESGLTVVLESDISGGVLRARTTDEKRQRASIRQYAPKAVQGAFAELAGLPGTTLYRCLEEGRLVYWSSVLRKPVNPI